ncbi:MAG: DJ-1/PfpI family protein [Bacteroidota bacterium]
MKKLLVILLCTLSLQAIKASDFSKNTQPIDGPKKRTVGILIFYNAEVLDFAGPFEVFSVASQMYDNTYFDVRMIAKTKDPIKAVNGLSVNPDHSFDDAPKLDILIISGGMGASLVLKDEESMKWVKKTVKKSELTISICTGAAILAKLGFLDNKPYCTHHTIYDYVQGFAPTAKPQQDKRYVQSDEKIYTSAGISAGIDLSFHMVEILCGKEVASNTAMYMEYKGYQ